MKKILLILFVVICVASTPCSAYANGPTAQYYEDLVEVLIEDYSKYNSIELHATAEGEDEKVDLYTIDFLQERCKTRIKEQRIVDIYAKDYDYFYMVIKTKDGDVLRTDTYEIDGAVEFIYSASDNTLIRGNIENRSLTLAGVMFLLFMLALPLIFTVIAEIAVGAAFHLKPTKFIVRINFLTNPIMNILIIMLAVNTYLKYAVIVLVLELIVVGVEYLYYTFKYREESKKKLLIFTAAANAASWALYSAFIWLLGM